MIESTLPDIILFQECNRLKHSENLENFMKNFPNYNYNIQYSHPNILRSRASICIKSIAGTIKIIGFIYIILLIINDKILFIINAFFHLN
ncbi:endonuclease exonuclease phosphatase [Acanthamoeba polyphaga mimivirus]|uniref:Endonuclease exonuclease phosphatase n=1 Tax=Acanthamoeba polyphaga mimivirus TaxID=212035 RepID=A0A2L2DMG8_MIMIV|nr:endonuclease exonuclease phosphatase [Acanthamoeba polyphaga mimivirus]